MKRKFLHGKELKIAVGGEAEVSKKKVGNKKQKKRIKTNRKRSRNAPFFI
ncbi:MAG: hypothetical protein MJZ69_08355 [Bacteroidaceae bacterium]|nr:hypothetical protein [Bacteroidaceae bacterium]